VVLLAERQADPRTSAASFFGSDFVKKGRHRRFEEARSMKRAVEVIVEPCPECGADPEDDHASWCMYESDELEDAEESDAVERSDT
jgi:hypothetical protein